MAITWEMIFTDRVTVTPKATLGDGTDVTDYADSMVMELKGTDGDYTGIQGAQVAFATPDQKTSSNFVEWSTLSASQPAFVQPLMESWTGSVSASVVNKIEAQNNKPMKENVPSWAGILDE